MKGDTFITDEDKKQWLIDNLNILKNMNIQNYYQLQIPQHQIEDNDEVLHPLDDNLIEDYVHNNDMSDTILARVILIMMLLTLMTSLNVRQKFYRLFLVLNTVRKLLVLFRLSVAEIMKKVRVV